MWLGNQCVHRVQRGAVRFRLMVESASQTPHHLRAKVSQGKGFRFFTGSHT